MRRVARHRILVAGRQTRVRLGSAISEALQDIADQTGSSIDALVTEIDRGRRQQKLDVAIHDYAVAYYRAIMQAALHGDAGQRCAIVPANEPEHITAEPLSTTPKVIRTDWRAQPWHRLYLFACQVASRFVRVLPGILHGGEIVPTDCQADPAVRFASPTAP